MTDLPEELQKRFEEMADTLLAASRPEEITFIDWQTHPQRWMRRAYFLAGIKSAAPLLIAYGRAQAFEEAYSYTDNSYAGLLAAAQEERANYWLELGKIIAERAKMEGARE